MLILVCPGSSSEHGEELEIALLQALPAGSVEPYRQVPVLGKRLRRRIYDIDLVVCCVLDINSLSNLETIRRELKNLATILIVSEKTGQEASRLYRFFPRSVLRMQENTDWIVSFVQKKMNHLKKGGL